MKGPAGLCAPVFLFFFSFLFFGSFPIPFLSATFFRLPGKSFALRDDGAYVTEFTPGCFLASCHVPSPRLIDGGGSKDRA